MPMKNENAKTPTADDVAQIIVAAARAEGEDPLAVAQGRWRCRSRVYAFISLGVDFPAAPRISLMRMCGAPPGHEGSMIVSALQIARRIRGRAVTWYSVARLNDIRAAIGLRSVTIDEAEMRRIPIDDASDDNGRKRRGGWKNLVGEA